MKMKIKTGDLVTVLHGKDRGKRGKVIQTMSAERRVVVEGVNQLTKHTRAGRGPRGEQKGQKINFFAPLHVSNVALVCPKCQKHTRIGMSVLADGKKARVCKHCKEAI